MTKRNRALMYALGLEDNTPQFDPDDTGPIEHQTIDPDHPETMQNLSLVEYVHLTQDNANEVSFGEVVEEGVVVAQEGFADNMQNFKNWFQRSMANEDAYLDSLQERYKAIAQSIQAANDKPANNTPISLFGDYVPYLIAGMRPMKSAQTIQTELDRMLVLNTLFDKSYLPSYEAEMKLAMEIISQGATDVEGAFKKAYQINHLAPLKGFESILTRTGTIRFKSGVTHTTKETEPYLGSIYFEQMEVPDFMELKLERGFEVKAMVEGKRLQAGKVQMQAATRAELMKIVDTANKILVLANKTVDNMFGAERRMLMDKVNNFESAHRSWRSYPQEERRKISLIMAAGDSACDRAHCINAMLMLTRKSLRAIERYVELSLKRLG